MVIIIKNYLLQKNVDIPIKVKCNNLISPWFHLIKWVLVYSILNTIEVKIISHFIMVHKIVDQHHHLSRDKQFYIHVVPGIQIQVLSAEKGYIYWLCHHIQSLSHYVNSFSSLNIKNMYVKLKFLFMLEKTKSKKFLLNVKCQLHLFILHPLKDWAIGSYGAKYFWRQFWTYQQLNKSLCHCFGEGDTSKFLSWLCKHMFEWIWC